MLGRDLHWSLCTRRRKDETEADFCQLLADVSEDGRGILMCCSDWSIWLQSARLTFHFGHLAVCSCVCVCVCEPSSVPHWNFNFKFKGYAPVADCEKLCCLSSRTRQVRSVTAPSPQPTTEAPWASSSCTTSPTRSPSTPSRTGR